MIVVFKIIVDMGADQTASDGAKRAHLVESRQKSVPEVPANADLLAVEVVGEGAKIFGIPRIKPPFGVPREDGQIFKRDDHAVFFRRRKKGANGFGVVL